MKRAILILLVCNLLSTSFLIWRSFSPSVAVGSDQPLEPWPEIDLDSAVSYTYKAELVRVIDGDTVVLNVDLGFETWLHNQTIRFYGLNTPEITGGEKPEGLKVKAWLEERLYGQEITLQSIQDKKGSFGRWLGILFVDGQSINNELIAGGMAEKR